MNDYQTRLQAFTAWPHGLLLRPQVMAAAGFYQSDWETDEVMCFSCRVRVKGWDVGDDPFEKHAVASPYCSLVNKIFMGTFEERLDSFYLWSKGKKPSAVDMASAGFYHSNKQKDTVTCFSCLVRVEQWSAQDDPIHRHVGAVAQEEGWWCPWLERIQKHSEPSRSVSEQGTQTMPTTTDAKPAAGETEVEPQPDANATMRSEQSTEPIKQPTSVSTLETPVSTSQWDPKSMLNMFKPTSATPTVDLPSSAAPKEWVAAWDDISTKGYSRPQPKASLSNHVSNRPTSTVQRTSSPAVSKDFTSAVQRTPSPAVSKAFTPPAPKAPLSAFDTKTSRCKKCLNIFKYDQNFFDHWQRKHAANTSSTVSSSSEKPKSFAPKYSPPIHPARFQKRQEQVVLPNGHMLTTQQESADDNKSDDRTLSQCGSVKSQHDLRTTEYVQTKSQDDGQGSDLDPFESQQKSPPRSPSPSQNATLSATVRRESERTKRVRSPRIDIWPVMASPQGALLSSARHDTPASASTKRIASYSDDLLLDFSDEKESPIEDNTSESRKTSEDARSHNTVTEASTADSARAYNTVAASGVPEYEAHVARQPNKKPLASPIPFTSSTTTRKYANNTGASWDAAPADYHQSW